MTLKLSVIALSFVTFAGVAGSSQVTTDAAPAKALEELPAKTSGKKPQNSVQRAPSILDNKLKSAIPGTPPRRKKKKFQLNVPEQLKKMSRHGLVGPKMLKRMKRRQRRARQMLGKLEELKEKTQPQPKVEHILDHRNLMLPQIALEKLTVQPEVQPELPHKRKHRARLMRTEESFGKDAHSAHGHPRQRKKKNRGKRDPLRDHMSQAEITEAKAHQQDMLRMGQFDSAHRRRAPAMNSMPPPDSNPQEVETRAQGIDMQSQMRHQAATAEDETDFDPRDPAHLAAADQEAREQAQAAQDAQGGFPVPPMAQAKDDLAQQQGRYEAPN